MEKREQRKPKGKTRCHFCNAVLTGSFFVGIGADGSEIPVCPACRRAFNVPLKGIRHDEQ
jgi:ribosome-binding protein aMBF1 (putative translation factor)